MIHRNSLFLRPVTGELFTALIELTKTFESESELSGYLDDYIKSEEARLEELKAFSLDLRRHSHLNLAMSNEQYVSNPVNAFLLVKRFSLESKQKFDKLIKDRSAETTFFQNLEQVSRNLPDNDDLKGSADAILRLQDTYNLPTRVIADGKIHPNSTSPQLSAEDCFYIGMHSFDQGDIYHTKLWMEEALNRFSGVQVGSLSKITLLDYLSYAHMKQGNYRQALVLTNEWLTLDPDHVRANQNKEYYENKLHEILEPGVELKGDVGDWNSDPFIYHTKAKPDQSNENKAYEALCRGENIEDVLEKFNVMYKKSGYNLHCQYYVPHSYFLLQPVKEEVMFADPRIVLWHDVITDSEIEGIIDLAKPRLNRATVQNAITGKLEYAHYRISKSAWLRSGYDPLIAKMDERINMLTGLNIRTAEELQVVNYGIGGHYEPHFDFARKREKSSFEKQVGNRIATLLFYLSDIQAGGATVFTKLGAKVWPKKGSAAFWYNLKRSGEGDLRTRHAACPVLAGSKWVMNKWFHERGQETARPCSKDKTL